MSGNAIKLDRSGLLAAGDGYQNVSRAPLGRASRGEVLLVRPRASKLTVNSTNAPAGTPIEGPYIRLIPAFTIGEDYGFKCKPMLHYTARLGDTFGYTDGLGVPQTLTVAEDLAADPYFEVDANCGVPIIMPFDGSVELVTSISGVWAYDYMSFMPPEKANPTRRGQIQSCFRQTRDCPPLNEQGNTRDVFVPLGAHSVEINCSDPTVPPAVALYADDVRAAGGSLSMNMNTSGGFWYGMKVSVANARLIRVTTAANQQARIIFHIGFT